MQADPPSRAPTLTRDQLRELDRRAIHDYGLPGTVLMENAGRNTAHLLHRLWPDSGAVVVVCGRGNNGGDGFVIARHLELLGRPVRILLATDPGGLSGDAAVHFAVASRAGIPIVNLASATPETWRAELSAAAVVVDALLGTGSAGPPRGGIAVAIEAVNAWRRHEETAVRRRVWAVDLPSGLDCDTGATPGACLRADATGTFVARKPGFGLSHAPDFTGPVHVLDIGAPCRLLAEFGISAGPIAPGRT
jgi:NAD(P)H-hydrate epimerase